jgi:hypothetical protein
MAPMIARALPTPRQRLARQRQHGAILQPEERRELERAGWRTTLDFCENNVRGRDGRLLQVQDVWHAEAERDTPRGVAVIAATASSADEVWAKLRRQAELAEVRRRIDHDARSGERAAVQAS